MSNVTKAAGVLLVAFLVRCDARSPAEPAAEAAATGSLAVASAASAQRLVHTSFPSAEDPGGPFYARIGPPIPPFVFADGGWAAIPFYRDPACLLANRPDFNLLDFFDAPAAFACPMTVHGSTLWHGAVGNGAPHTLMTKGAGAVPVWFLPEPEIANAIADGQLSIVDLAALPGLLVGNASQFNEVLHPSPLPPELGGGGHPAPKLVLGAHGELQDGRRFDVQIASVAGVNLNVRIRFR